LLAERVRQFLRDDAGDHVGRTAGGETDQDTHRVIGVGACHGAAGNEHAKAESKQADHGLHDVLT
jgi:hypothetical protein